MKNLLFIILFIIVSCGRPSSTEQEANEIKVRQRQEVLSNDYKEVQGHYKGTLEILDDGSIFNATMNLRVVQDIDPSTGLPLKPKIVGSVSIYEVISMNEDRIITSYGITSGSYDNDSGQLALDISEKLNVKGFANNNVINGILHSEIKGDVGKFKLVRSE